MRKLVLVFALLLALLGCTTESRRAEMRGRLSALNALNRADSVLTATNRDEALSLVDFFDRHGTANEQMLAHYLLGRCYADMHEAPMALQCYQQAIECADTTAENCDFAQLARVYAQMGDLFYYQGLYSHSLNCYNVSTSFTIKGKDTLTAALIYEQKSAAYLRMDQPDSAIYVIENVFSQYSQLGVLQFATRSLGTIMGIYIEREDFERAQELMTKYESTSKIFNEDGTITSGLEVYYYYKGLIYLHDGLFKSALHCFNKAYYEGKDLNTRSAGAIGLGKLYEHLNKPDSVAKYFKFAYIINDSIYQGHTTEIVQRIQSIYNYSRYQKIAFETKEKNAEQRIIIWICIGCLLLVTLIGSIIYMRTVSKKREISLRYRQSLEVIRQARHDISILKAHQTENANLIAEKEQVILEQEDVLRNLYHNPLIHRFIVKGLEPSPNEWQQIKELIFDLYPKFRAFMETNHAILNDKESKTCILIIAGFKPKIISSMLNVHPSYISKIRIEMLSRLFCTDGKAKEFDKKIIALR